MAKEEVIAPAKPTASTDLTIKHRAMKGGPDGTRSSNLQEKESKNNPFLSNRNQNRQTEANADTLNVRLVQSEIVWPQISNVKISFHAQICLYPHSNTGTMNPQRPRYIANAIWYYIKTEASVTVDKSYEKTNNVYISSSLNTVYVFPQCLGPLHYFLLVTLISKTGSHIFHLTLLKKTNNCPNNC